MKNFFTKMLRRFICSFLAVFLFGTTITFVERQTYASNETTPKIAVVIPVYNVEPYLKECLDSVVHQTFKALKIICINDGSTDGSLKILREYEKNDPRVTVIDQENKGVSVARNVGIELALQSKCEFITFMDSDDYLELDTYEKAYKKAISSGADVVVWGRDYFKVVDGEEAVFRTVDFSDEKPIKNFHRIVVWDKLYKRDLIEQNGFRFKPGMSYAEDVLFNREVFKKLQKLAFVPGVFYHHRRGLGNSLTDIGFEQYGRRPFFRLRRVA